MQPLENKQKFEVFANGKAYTVFAYETAIGIVYDCYSTDMNHVKLMVTNHCENPPQFAENGLVVTARSIAIGKAIQNYCT